MRSCGEEKRVDRRRGSGERGEERGADGGGGERKGRRMGLRKRRE